MNRTETHRAVFDVRRFAEGESYTVTRRGDVLVVNTRGRATWRSPGFIDAHCSNCGETPEHEPGSSVPLTNYCPNCGCEMEIDWGEEARHEE